MSLATSIPSGWITALPASRVTTAADAEPVTETAPAANHTTPDTSTPAAPHA